MQNRITNSLQGSSFLANLQRTVRRQSELQDQLSTGRRITGAADDPAATRQIMDIDVQLGDIDQYQRRIGDATGMLAARDSALASAMDALHSVRDRIVQVSYGGVLTASDRQAVAADLLQLKESIRSAANSRFNGEYLFSGTASGTEPFPGPAGSYDGTTGVMSLRVGPGMTVDTTVDGSTIFGVSAPTIFDTIDLAIADINVGDAASLSDIGTTVLAAVDLHMQSISTAQAATGAAQSRLETISEQLDSMRQRLDETRSGLADVDMAKAYVDYQSQNTLYQSALAAGARIMRTSLLDFL